MATQLKGLDAEVLQLSSRLAVRTLQLQMEHIFCSLEAEALDCFSEAQRAGACVHASSGRRPALHAVQDVLAAQLLPPPVSILHPATHMPLPPPACTPLA